MNSRDTQTIIAGNAFLSFVPGKKIVKYRPDEVIFSQGAACTEVNYIEEGLVKLTTVFNCGRGAVLGILDHGSFLVQERLSVQAQQKQRARQAFLALVEYAVDQVLFDAPIVARQKLDQMRGTETILLDQPHHRSALGRRTYTRISEALSAR